MPCLHQRFSAGIDGGGGFVQNQDRRIGHRGPGNGKQLPLALAQVGAVAVQHGVVAVGQTADKAVSVGQLGRGDALLIGGVQTAVADILHNSTGEQVGILQHDAQTSGAGRLF